MLFDEPLVEEKFPSISGLWGELGDSVGVLELFSSPSTSSTSSPSALCTPLDLMISPFVLILPAFFFLCFLLFETI